MAKNLSIGPKPPANAHEWFSFVGPDGDGDNRTFMVDLSFLESNYTCIYGQGCKGIEEKPNIAAGHGCCVHGAHFVDEEDLENVEPYVERLTPDIWQNKAKGDKNGWSKTDKEGVTTTKRVNGVCIFHNEPGFAGGQGCAFHILALKDGANPVTYKPSVCWQVPIRREDEISPDGSVVTKIQQWDRTHWGEGGHDFHWWCMEDPAAFVGKEPVYRGFHWELTEMMGVEAYEQLVEYLDARKAAGIVSLPHPTVRKQKPVLPTPGIVEVED